MRLFQLLIIVMILFLQSCKTNEYSLNRYNEKNGNFICKDNICSRGYIPCQSKFKVSFSEIAIKRKKIYAEGVVRENVSKDIGVGFCSIYLGKETTDEEISLQKQMSNTDKKGNFKFKVRLKEGDFIVFHTVGYCPEIYQFGVSTIQINP